MENQEKTKEDIMFERAQELSEKLMKVVEEFEDKCYKDKEEGIDTEYISETALDILKINQTYKWWMISGESHEATIEYIERLVNSNSWVTKTFLSFTENHNVESEDISDECDGNCQCCEEIGGTKPDPIKIIN